MKKHSYVFFLLMAFWSFSVEASNILWNGVMYDDEKVAELITVITTTNPIPSIPTTKHIYPSQKSLFQIPAFTKCKKIIVFDGIQPGYEDRETDYDIYKRRIQILTETDPYFSNTELVFCDHWAHIAGAVKEAMSYVTTPYVFVHQHDFVLMKPFDLNAVIATMERNPNVKHVKLANPGINSHWHPSEIDENVHGPTFIPLCRTFIWSDNDHISPTAYYTDFVFPNCGFGAMEHFLWPMFIKERERLGNGCHPKYGTYVYGNLKDGGYLFHSNGRDD